MGYENVVKFFLWDTNFIISSDNKLGSIEEIRYLLTPTIFSSSFKRANNPFLFLSIYHLHYQNLQIDSCKNYFFKTLWNNFFYIFDDIFNTITSRLTPCKWYCAIGTFIIATILNFQEWTCSWWILSEKLELKSLKESIEQEYVLEIFSLFFYL